MRKKVREFRVCFAIAILSITSLGVPSTHANGRLSVVVPLAQGGALDRFARTAERFLPNVMDVAVSVENFSPKRGEDGYREFLDRPADGSSVLAWFEPAAAAYLPGISLDDLTIINVQEIESPILAARSDLGWRSLGAMLKGIRENPGRYRYGGGDFGGGTILTKALLNKLGLTIVHARYPSGGKARKALGRGDVDLTAGSLNAIRKLGDRITPIAVFSPRRLRAWPEVPTIREALGRDASQAIYGAVYRFYAVPRAFAEEKPEAFATLVEGFRRMTEDDVAFRADAQTRGVGALWLGPIESYSLIQRSHQHFEKLIAEQRSRSGAAEGARNTRKPRNDRRPSQSDLP